MSKREHYNRINHHIHEPFINPLVDSFINGPSFNEISPVINHMGNLLDMVGDMLVSDPHVEIHVVELGDMFPPNIREQNLDIKTDKSGPKIEVLDDTESEGIKKPLLIEPVKKQVHIEPPKKQQKWVVNESNKSRIGILNNSELDKALNNAFNTT
jgi:hypothetical protein